MQHFQIFTVAHVEYQSEERVEVFQLIEIPSNLVGRKETLLFSVGKFSLSLSSRTIKLRPV